MDMREFTKDKCALAVAYAEDGAYASAARVLRVAAATLQTHAVKMSAELERMSEKQPSTGATS